MGKLSFILGYLKNVCNPRISVFSFISSNSKIDRSARVYRGVKIKKANVGAHSYIAAYTDIENAEIGNYCSIADHCRIGMSGHSLDFISTSPLFTESNNALQERWVDHDVFVKKSQEERVHIGNDVWIGSHVLIKGGVCVHDGACIAAGAVVVSDVPPFAIVGGVPAKVIRYRFDSKTIESIMETKWWDKDDAVLKKNIDLFQSEMIDAESLKQRLGCNTVPIPRP